MSDKNGGRGAHTREGTMGRDPPKKGFSDFRFLDIKNVPKRQKAGIFGAIGFFVSANGLEIKFYPILTF